LRFERRPLSPLTEAPGSADDVSNGPLAQLLLTGGDILSAHSQPPPVIISASVSWLIVATIGSGRPSLPKFANWARAKRFSLTKSAVNPDGARQGMRNEHLGKARLVVENTDDGRLLQPHDLAFGHCGSCSHAPRLSRQAPLSAEFVSTQDRNDGFSRCRRRSARSSSPWHADAPDQQVDRQGCSGTDDE
jgi:hypothetical protein